MVNSGVGKNTSSRISQSCRFVLTVREGPNAGEQFDLGGRTITIGHASGNDLVIDYPGVAAHQAVLVGDGARWSVHDLDSPGGTFVNGIRVETGHPVSNGDTIGLGTSVTLLYSEPESSMPDQPVSGQYEIPRFPASALSTSEESTDSSDSPRTGRDLGRLCVVLGALLGATGVLAMMLMLVLGGSGAESHAAPIAGAPTATPPSDTVLPLPTVAPADAATATVIPELVRLSTPILPPSPTPKPCLDDAVFVGNVTLDEGSVVSAGQRIDKTWRLRNTGTCAWRGSYRLKFVSGDNLGVVGSVLVAHTDPEMETDVAVPMFAPKVPGEYACWWQMMNPQGEVFGQPVPLEVLVRPEPTVTPISGSDDQGDSDEDESKGDTDDEESEAAIHFWADSETIQAGDKTILHIAAQDVASVWLDGDIIIGGRDTREVAPCSTTGYTLDVQLRNGEHVYRTVVVNVVGSCSTHESSDVLVDFTVHPTQLIAGQTAAISYTVLNKGDYGIDDFDLVFGPGIAASEPLTVRTGLELAPGYGLRSVYSYTWPISGVFQTVLWVDQSSLVEEPGGTSNTASRVVVVQGS